MLAALTAKFIPNLSQVWLSPMNSCGHRIRAGFLTLN